MDKKWQQEVEEWLLEVDSKSSTNEAIRPSLDHTYGKLKASLQKLQELKVPEKPKTFKKVPPQAYAFKDIYSKRKDTLIRMTEDQERKQRIFRSRPMPDFQEVHKREALKAKAPHRVTMPVTPNVLKNSQDMELKRCQRVEQLLKERQEEIKKTSIRDVIPKARSAPPSGRPSLKPDTSTKRVTPNVLKNSQDMEHKRPQRVEQLLRERQEQVKKTSIRDAIPKARSAPPSGRPSLKPDTSTMRVTQNVPKKSQNMELKRRQLPRERQEQVKKTSIRDAIPKARSAPPSNRRPLNPDNSIRLKQEPFNLSADLRVQQRRLYNEKTTKAQELKRRELEELRKSKDREEFRKNRQMTTFRARPNPFSNSAR
ncbi:hypothetical protein KR018_008071 [Drosophila ironensis]|nr:hypothetical protein KR018_008071 [Drosophila ironensis]